MPTKILRLESLAWFCLSLYFFQYIQIPWWVILILFFSPDLFMVGYLLGPKKGAFVYNIAHTTVLPVILGFYGFFFKVPLCMELSCIWWSHINFDRMLGIGLKFSDSFRHTHLGQIGAKNK